MKIIRLSEYSYVNPFHLLDEPLIIIKDCRMYGEIPYCKMLDLITEKVLWYATCIKIEDSLPKTENNSLLLYIPKDNDPNNIRIIYGYA